jgi:hypothetical protein
MATPRRGWFKVATDILEHYTDPRERGIAVGLMAVYARRWANGASADELAGTITLTRGEFRDITGSEFRRGSLGKLDGLAGVGVGFAQGQILVQWPKFAEFQGLHARESGSRFLPVVPKQSRVEKSKKRDAPTERRKPSPVDDFAWLIPILPGGSETDREKFLRDEWAVICAEAEADAEQTKTQVSTQLKRIAVRYWKHRQRNPDGPRAKGRAPGGAEHHGASRIFKGRDPETGEVMYE